MGKPVAPTMPGVSEYEHQKALVALCRRLAPRYPALDNLFAVPNAAKRTRWEAATLLATGMVAGVPDLLLPWPQRDGEGHIIRCGLALELKVAGGTVSEHQRVFGARLASAGWTFAICYGWEAGWQAISSYLEIPDLGV